jgi:hypothetical protein
MSAREKRERHEKDESALRAADINKLEKTKVARKASEKENMRRSLEHRPFCVIYTGVTLISPPPSGGDWGK